MAAQLAGSQVSASGTRSQGVCTELVTAPGDGEVLAIGGSAGGDILVVYRDAHNIVRSIGRLVELSPTMKVGSRFAAGQVIGRRRISCPQGVRARPTGPADLHQVVRRVRLPEGQRHIQIVGAAKTKAQLAAEAREALRKANPEKYAALLVLEKAVRSVSPVRQEFLGELATYRARCTGASAEVVVRERRGTAVSSDFGVSSESEKRQGRWSAGGVGLAAAGDKKGTSAVAGWAGFASGASASERTRTERWETSGVTAWSETVTWTKLQERASTPYCQTLFANLQRERVRVRDALAPAVERARAAGWLDYEIEIVLREGGLPWLLAR